jgi:hypothetical protein
MRTHCPACAARMATTVQLPRSSTRLKSFSYLKLLRQVSPDATSGFDFVGVVLEPGATVDISSLRPSDDYPAVPVLLEMAHMMIVGRGHRRNPATHILWKYNAEENRFQQILQCHAHGLEWVQVITPAAIAALPPERDEVRRPDLLRIAHQLSRTIEVELYTLTRSDRVRVLGALHDYFAIRIGMNQSAFGIPVQLDMSPHFAEHFHTQ